MSWRVEWGDIVAVVEATDEVDAWCAFCVEHGLNDALRHPNKFRRSINRLTELPATQPGLAVTSTEVSAVSPWALQSSDGSEF